MLEIADIRAAAARIQGQVLDTPCVESRTLSQITGAQVFLKFENLQFTASFKERGACNKLLQLDAAQRHTGVVAMSAGNHAQGVAYHAQRLGLRAVIVMPRFTPGVKVERTRGFGAEIVLHGDSLDEARDHAQMLAREQGLTLVHPYDDEAIVAGQGTVGLEILAAHPELDAIVVAVGGGGLIAGIAVAAKSLKPSIEIGVQEKESELVFYVSDNGLGIEPVYHERIFGLFNKLDASSEGTGIGLALVRRIIEYHGGRIWVESEGLGKGAVFFFTLPG